METPVGSGSRVVDALRAVCSMQDENTEELRRRTLGLPKDEPSHADLKDEESQAFTSHPEQKPWPVTPTPSEREAELQRAQKTNIWDWRLKGRFREKPKTKETRKAMFMYQKHREAVSNLGIFKIDQDISAYEEILQQGIDKRNKRMQDGKGVPPLPIRPSTAAVFKQSRSQDFASSSLASTNQRARPATGKSSTPARPASAAAHTGHTSGLSSPPPQAASRLAADRQNSPGGQARPASAAFASQSPNRSQAASGERAKSAMPWLRGNTSTTDGKIKDVDTFLTACREDSREIEPAVSLTRQSRDGEVGGQQSERERELDQNLVSMTGGDRETLIGLTSVGPGAGIPLQWIGDETELSSDSFGRGQWEQQLQLKGTHNYRLELAETMKPPEERNKAEAPPKVIQDFLPSPKNITPKTEFQHGKEYLHKLKNDLETKIATLEHIYTQEEASPRTLQAIIARKNKLNAGWTSESLAKLEHGQKATAEAAKSLADIDAKMADFRDVLTVMTEEWLRVDDLMDHVDLLMKTFDTMTDGHLLLSGNALPARIEGVSDEGPSTPVRGHRGKHLHDDSVTEDGGDGGSTNRSRGGLARQGSMQIRLAHLLAAGTPPPPPAGSAEKLSIVTGNLSPSPGSLVRTPTQNLLRQGTMSRQQSSKSINQTPGFGKHGKQGTNMTIEKQKALAVQDWLDSAGVDAGKIYNAAVVDRTFMGHPDAHKQDRDVWKRVSSSEIDSAAKKATETEGGVAEGDEVKKGEEQVEGTELRWHHGMSAVRSLIKSGSVTVQTASTGTQIPEANEIERTLSHKLRGRPKFIQDFAVRGLTFPAEWEGFLSGMPTDQAPKLLTTAELSQTILDIYFAKLLHENKERTTQEFKMSMCEYVCFHLLEDSGDMDDAKVLLRDLAYSVAEQHELSKKFRLFARFCGILEAVPDVILDFYLLFMLECKPFIVKPMKRGSALDKLVSRGRDFIMSECMETVFEKAFSQRDNSATEGEKVKVKGSMTAREFALRNKMSKIPILRQVEDQGVKMDLCDVDDMWLNVSEEFEQQWEQGRVEAGKLLLAADVNQDGNVDLEEFVEIIRLFDASFSKAQVAKMYFDAIKESGSDNITHKAFLVVGDKYKLFQTRGLKMLDLSQRDVSALNAQSLMMLNKAVENEDEKIVQRINIFTNAGNEQEAKGKQILQEYETLKEGLEEACALMDKVGEDSTLVPDPNPLWAQYHAVNKQLAGVILNFGVRRVINTLTVLGK